MKTPSVVVLTLLVLGVGGLLLIPSLIDWSRFKAPLAEALRAACGHPVELAGDVSFSVLPTLTFSATGIDIANPPGATEPRLLHLGRLDVRVALLPLLSGRIEIAAIALDRPVLVLEALADGRRGWLAAGDDQPQHPLPPILGLARVDVTDGTVLWRNDTAGTTLRVTAIRGRFGIAGPAGPFTVRGEAVIQGIPVTAEATADSLGNRDPTPVHLALALADGGASLHYAGLATTGFGGSTLRIQGDGRLEATHPARLATLLTTALGAPIGAALLPPALEQPLTARAVLDVGTTGVALTGLDLQLGATTATGSARFTPGAPPALELRLAAGRLDLAPWLTPWAAPLMAPLMVGDAVDAGTLAGLRLPFGASLRLDLTVDALGIQHETLHQTRLAARLADGTLTVERLAAVGPGGSELTVAGSLTRIDDRPVVDATLEVDADNLRILLGSFELGYGIDLGTVPAGRLGRASLIARLRGRPDDFQVTGADLRIDTTRMKGGVAYRNHGRPAFGIRLNLDHLDVDSYFGSLSLPDGSRWDRLRGGLAALLARGDVNLQAHLGHLMAGGLPMRDLELDLTADHGALTIRSARVAELAGLAGHVQGTLARIDPVQGADLDFAAEVGSAATLERLSGDVLPPPLHRLGAFKVNGHATGDGERLALTLSAEGAGGRVDASGTLAPEALRLAEPIRVHAVFPETGPVIRLFAPTYKAEAGHTEAGHTEASDEPGATDLSAVLAGDTGRLHLTGLTGTAAGVTFQGRIDADLTGPRPSFDARLQTGEIVLDRLLPASGPPAPRHWFSLWPKAATPVPKRWSVDPLDFGWLTAADGQLAVDAAGLTVAGQRLGSPVLRAALANGTLRLEQFDGELMQGRFSVVGRLAALPPPGVETTPNKGFAETAPNKGFTETAPNNRSAETASATRPAEAAATEAPVGMTSAVTPAEATLAVTLVGARVDHGLLYAGTVPGAVDVITGTLDLDLDLKARGNSELALVGSLAGNGRVAIRDGRLQGIDLAELDRRLAAIHHPKDVVGLLTLSQDEAAGETPFDRLAGTVTVDCGIATTTDLTLTAASGTGETQGFVDLPNRVLSLGTHFRLPHDPPLPAIGVILGGTLDRPHRTIDTREVRSYLVQRLTTPTAPTSAAPGAISPGEFLRGLFRSPTPSSP